MLMEFDPNDTDHNDQMVDEFVRGRYGDVETSLNRSSL